jgi:translation initiation factor 2 alpha subunit (eIF-2alpha)
MTNPKNKEKDEIKIGILPVPEKKKRTEITTFALRKETRRMLDKATKKYNKTRDELINELLKQVV